MVRSDKSSCMGGVRLAAPGYGEVTQIVDNLRDTEPARESAQGSGAPSVSIGNFLAEAVWKSRWILLLSAAIAGVVGVFVAQSMQPVYEAAATLLITESPEPEAVNSPETLTAIASSNAMATRVLAALHLDQPPYRLTPQMFRVDHVEIEPVRGSRMIRVKVNLPDPVLAMRGADEVARQTVELARTLNQQDTAFLRDYLAAQLDASQTRKEQLQREMVEYRTRSQLELVETDADSLLEQRSQVSKLVIDIAAEEARLQTAERELATQSRVLTVPRSAAIEGALARVPVTETDERPAAPPTPQSAGTSRIHTQTNTPESGSRQPEMPEPDKTQTTTQMSASQKASTTLQTPIQRYEQSDEKQIRQTPIQRYEQSDEKQIRRPVRASDQPPSPDALPTIPPEAIGDFVNPVYEILSYQASVARTRLAALQRQRDELIKVRKVNAEQLQTLSTMYRTQIELRKLQTDYDLAEKIYLDLSMKHEQARVQAVSRSAHVQVLDPPVQPTEPVAPRKRRIVAAAVVAGLLVALASVIATAALRSRRPRIA